MRHFTLIASLCLFCGLVTGCGEKAPHSATQPLPVGTWERDDPEEVHRRMYEGTTHSTPKEMADTLNHLRLDRLTFLADGTVWQTPMSPWTEARWQRDDASVTISCDQYGDIGQPLDFPYRLEDGMLIEASDDSRWSGRWRRITELGSPDLPVGVWMYADPEAVLKASAERLPGEAPEWRDKFLLRTRATRFEFQSDGNAVLRRGEHTTTGRWVRKYTEVQFMPKESKLAQGASFRVVGERLLDLGIYEPFELSRVEGQ